MNIKQAQELSGVNAENIRFYEKQGLLSPARNKQNDYRKYTPEDIAVLKRIRALRMLDMPLPQIKAVLEGKEPVGAAAERQKERLEARSRELDAAIALCREVAEAPSLESLDVDTLLAKMDDPAHSAGLFRGWVDDYRRVALAEHEKRFTFLPDEAVTTPQEFTAALLAYADQEGKDIVITKESMYPEFTLDGIEYTAMRNYTAVRGCPVASIACEVAHPEDFVPADIPREKRRLMRLLHYLWVPAALLLLILLPRLELFATWEGWVLLVGLVTAVGVSSFRSWLLFYNEKHK